MSKDHILRISVTVPVPASEIDRAPVMLKLKPAVDAFRRALSAIGDHEYTDKVVRPRDESAPRRGRRPVAPPPTSPVTEVEAEREAAE